MKFITNLYAYEKAIAFYQVAVRESMLELFETNTWGPSKEAV